MLVFLRRLHRESPENLNSHPDRWDSVPVEEEARILQDSDEKPRTFMLSAWSGTRIVGNFYAWGSNAQIGTHVGDVAIALLKEVQGVGLARALMERGLLEAATLGITNVRLTVRTFNTPAIHLYEMLGFERVGTYREVARMPDGRLADEYIYQRIPRAPT